MHFFLTYNCRCNLGCTVNLGFIGSVIYNKNIGKCNYDSKISFATVDFLVII